MSDRHTLARLAVPILVASLATTACDQSASTGLIDHAQLHAASAELASRAHDGSVAGLATVVFAANARFHSTAQATRAGYAENSPCVASPAGGMGFHWLNASLVDPVFDPLHPEVVLYAPDADGILKLVAVEYIVIDVGQPAPTFAGEPLAVGGAPVPVPHWSLHAWLYRENPNGMFAPFNPSVICPGN